MLNLKKQENLKEQFVLFNVLFHIVNILVWGFYLILLYRVTGSVVILLIDSLVFYIGLYVGIIWGTVLVDRIGYRNLFRLISVLSALALIFILILLPQIGALYILFTIVRTIPRGMYWSIYHNFQLKELHGINRGRMIGSLTGIVILLGIALPTLSGALINYVGGYEVSFLLAAVVYLIGAIIPWQYNKVPRSEFRVEEVVKILKHPKIVNFGLMYVYTGATAVSTILITTVIPYILIGSEFGVGILVSVIGIITAIMHIVNRNTKLKDMLKLGFFSFVIEGIANLGLALFWTMPALVIRGLFTRVFSSIGGKIGENLDYVNQEKILGKDLSESAVEMTFLIETFYLVGRVIFCSMLILGIQFLLKENTSTLQIITAVTAFMGLIGFIWQVYLSKALKVKSSNPPV